MAKQITNQALIEALVEAGIVDRPNDVERVIIDIRPGWVPAVHVKYFGDPDKLALVVEAIGRDMLTVRTGRGPAPAPALAIVSDQGLTDLLLLANVTVDPGALAAWTPEQREEAAHWAALTHLSASDNPVHVPPRPEFLPEQGEG